MVDDLREKFIQRSEEIEREEELKAHRRFLGMEPWQLLVVAILLFLVVAVLGLMVLAVTGRLVLPF